MNRLLSGVLSLAILLLGSHVSALAGEEAGFAGCAAGSTPAYFNLSTSNSMGPCHYGSQSFGYEVLVYVSVFSVPFRQVRFSLPDPSFGVVVEETWNFPYTGDRTTGLEMDLPGCSGSSTLGRLLVYVPGRTIDPGCAPWKVDEGCTIVTCEGAVRNAEAFESYFSDSDDPDAVYCHGCFQHCQSLPPYDLFPPNGATDVPVDVQLSWPGPPSGNIPDSGWDDFRCWVLISSVPECSSLQWFRVPCQEKTFSPDFLQPGTRYYWKASWIEYFSGCSSGDGGESPIQSFTTAPMVAVEKSNWGRVKTLFRE